MIGDIFIALVLFFVVMPLAIWLLWWGGIISLVVLVEYKERIISFINRLISLTLIGYLIYGGFWVIANLPTINEILHSTSRNPIPNNVQWYLYGIVFCAIWFFNKFKIKKKT
jgi:hypothetical protein